MRTSLRPIVAAMLAAALLAACGGGGVPSGAVATVNGTEIPRDLVERIVTAQMEGPQVPPDDEGREEAEAEVQRNVLTTLIAVEIVEQLAAGQDVEPSQEELEEEFAAQIELAGGEEAFDGFLDTIGLTEEEYRDVIVADLARREAIAAEFGTEVSDDEVREAYEQQLEGSVNSRHILVESEDEAEEVLARLEDDEDFAELAVELSIDPGSGEQGGDLGPASPDQFVEEFGDALRDNDPGTVVGPVETEFGFHVIEVLEDPDFEELEPEIRGQLEQAAAQSPELIAVFEEAYAEADVELASNLGEWDPEVGQVVDPDAVGEGGPAGDPGQPPAGGEGQELTEEEIQQLLEEQLGDVDAP